MDHAYVGIEIGGSKLQVGVADESGTLRDCHRFTVDARRGGAAIREKIQDTLGKIITDGISLRAIGGGFGGPIDWRTGLIECSHQVEGWSSFALGQWLTEQASVPVSLDNDANVAALGEARHGAGQGFNPVFYVTLGSGVGGGLVVDGHIYHGAKPGEAEIGHIRLDRQGTIVESRCSGWAVDARIREAKKRHPESLMARLTRALDRAEAQQLGPACEQGDAIARDILRELAEDLAFGLSHVTHLFHPEVIVIGGGLALMGELLRAEVARALPRFVMKAFGGGPAVKLAALGERAVPVGAIELARAAATRISPSPLAGS